MPVAVLWASHHLELNSSLIFQYVTSFPFNDFPIQPKSCLIMFVLLHSWFHSSLTASAGQTATLSAKLSFSKRLLNPVGESHTTSQAESSTNRWSPGLLNPDIRLHLSPHLVLLKANPNPPFLSKLLPNLLPTSSQHTTLRF